MTRKKSFLRQTGLRPLRPRVRRPSAAAGRLETTLVEAGEGERADQAAVGLVRGVELFDLGDRGAPAEAGEVADQLDVAEVAGGQRVGFAAAEEGEALDRPGADFGDREEAGVVGRRRRCRSGRGRRRGRACAAPPSGRRRGPSTAVRPGRGRRSAPPAGRRGAPCGPRPSRAPQRPTMRRSIVAARLASISCPQTAAASASQGQSRRLGRKSGRRRMIGPTSGSRRKRWWKAPCPRRRRARSASARSRSPAPRGPPGGSSSQADRHGERRRVDRLGAEGDPAGAAQPGADQDRRAVDGEQAGGDAALDPQGAVGRAAAEPEGRGRPDLDLERSAALPTGRL